ncbi:polysaccharide deacetylase [Pseudonocardia endophytica]|nr:polysaccharide deacetylase [Pseudonocardia endophytica]
MGTYAIAGAGGDTGRAGPSSPAPAPAAAPAPPAAPAPAPTDVLWQDNAGVSHLFFHSLIVDPERAFADRHSAAGYHDYMITQAQFARILDQLYARNYVLVGPHQLASVAADGTVATKPLRLPAGKKPLVLSVDDVSYYEYMAGDGFADNLVVADDGRVRNTYVDANGTTHVGSYDVMPMVDDFVREHPDFSHDGARGIIGLTGYNGVLGYRTSPSVYGGRNPHLAADVDTATRVADALKGEGWEFASHSWGHINFTTSGLGDIERDTRLWKAEVQPIVGPTDLLIYPFGADISGLPAYSGPKYDYLRAQGFAYYFTIDASRTAWGQVGRDYLREARINIDGISLAAAMRGRPVLRTFFDPASVAEGAGPTP